jgi:hypothetical protein
MECEKEQQTNTRKEREIRKRGTVKNRKKRFHMCHCPDSISNAVISVSIRTSLAGSLLICSCFLSHNPEITIFPGFKIP